MRSLLLEGKVRHRRSHPFTYGLEHDVWYASLDVDELDALDGRLRLFRRNSRTVTEFRDEDHLPQPSRDVAAGIRALLGSEGEAPDGWRITLVTNLRVLGYVFNPASFFLCRDEAGILRVVVVEVHNTFGDRHVYLLRPRSSARGPGAGPFVATMAKDFFVSPFISLDGQYSVQVREDAEGLRLAINLRQAGRSLLSTSLVLGARPLTDRMLLRLLLRQPLVTHKTIALIHLHGLLLWLRGAPFFRHGAWLRTREAVR